MPTFYLPCARRALLATVLLVATTLPIAFGTAWLADALLGADTRATQVASATPDRSAAR